MRNAAREHARLPACALLCVTGLLGCNQILGINEPSEDLLDAAQHHPAADGGSAGFDAGSYGSDDDAGGDASAPSLPASTHAWAAWPMPNPVATQLPNPQAYSMDSSKLVTDSVTHLQWQRQTDGNAYTWPGAASYCDALAIDGSDDFRLPSRIELLSLIDFTALNPPIDASAFPGTAAAQFWSGSPYVAEHAHAWGVSFGFTDGYVFKASVEARAQVRCVRTGAQSQPRFSAAKDSVKDMATGLTWQRAAPAATYDWKAATKFCVELELGGNKGWRLPSVKELQTLVDERSKLPAIDGSVFPNTSGDYYWTSSQVPGFATQSWTVSFAYGFDGFFEVSSRQHLRCVR